ncbi:phage tail protein [Moellerella wisconsensis]|uniref:phage tail-collar fiber domain-containing protein n=1 Tax=Moellerella wisconsensis TaxID=158849 RepID=UPI001F4E673B|nr:phage tail protein [Moellerella wisconsensis]UNH25941.1 phage tail protein [Moellerella wisconsensis]
MKYFALLTKLGEELLAQATIEGTKLELTQMAVGDGGGKLPTPDTNQTKLIAEKYRAPINTLFIDEKNKNQIIAEQIIPENVGGWFIREVALFDKTGNLIAVANSPETYKPRLEEGSGRTLAVRMVLIVSHTDAVTLKVDPSVILATREYVNSQLTIIDKKLEALATQIASDLSNKVSKTQTINGIQMNTQDIPVTSQTVFNKYIQLDDKSVLNSFRSAGVYLQESGTSTTIEKGYPFKGAKGALIIWPADTQSNVSQEWLDTNGSRWSRAYNHPLWTDWAQDYSSQNKPTAADIGAVDIPTGQALSTRITSAQNTANQANKAASSAQKDAASANDNAELRALKTTKVNGYPLTNNVFLTTKDIFKNMTDLGSDNLSTIFSPGIYYQKTNASALWSRNYPKDGVGGVLIVYRTNQGATITNNACVQVYYSNENIVYTRIYNGSNWVGGWASQLNTANTTVDRNGYLKVTNSSAVSDCPVGAPIPWPQSTAPSGFLVCNGQSFNKTTYPLLAAAYPSGVLPDLRAEFIRGLDAGRNVDSERVVLSEQSDAIRNITGSMKFSEMIGGIPSDGAFYVSSNPSVPKTFHSSGGGTSPTISFDPSRVVPTANENRPRNIAFLYIVRAA